MNYRNLTELFRRQAERLDPRPALRFKRHGIYHDVSWGQYAADARACAAALIDAGIRPADRVGLLAENRVEWLIADLGILGAAAVNVPPHAPLTAPQVRYQLEDAGARWLFVSTLAQLDKVRQIFETGGKGHSCGIYSHDADHIHRLALVAPVSRIMVRQVQSSSNAGTFTNGMPMTSSMGCGIWGGNITNENISLKHYMNVTWVSRPIPEDRPSEEELFGEFYNS